MKSNPVNKLQMSLMKGLKIMETQRTWFNRKTGQPDNRPPITDEIALQYIQQSNAAKAVYTIYRESGKTILEAITNVLSAELGQVAPFPLSVE